MGITRIIGVDEIEVVVGSCAVEVGTRIPYTVGVELRGILQNPVTIHLDVCKVVRLAVCAGDADVLLDDDLLVVALCHRQAAERP